MKETEDEEDIREGLKALEEYRRMIKLTQEEMDKVANAVDGNKYQTTADYWDAIISDTCKAQSKKVVEWGDETCKEHQVSNNTQRRRECTQCWQSLLKEIE